MTSRVKAAYSLWALFGLLLVGLHIACTPERQQMRIIPNQPPETVITGAPLDSSNAFHRYHVYWAGFDPDGQVVEYGVAVSDSNIVPDFLDYRRTTATDSIIDFVANNEVVLSHQIWVFAVDNEGERDPTPARAFFNAVDVNRPIPSILSLQATVAGETFDLNLSGDVPDTIPSGASPPEGIDPSVRVTWTAYDPDLGGSITAYRVKLSTESDFTEIPADSTAATFSQPPSGDYEFQVGAVDNAGARSREPAVARWVANFEPDTYIVRAFSWNRWTGDEEMDFSSGIPTIRDSSRVILIYGANDQHYRNDRLIEDGNVDFVEALGGYSFRIWRTDIRRGSTRRGPFSVFFGEDVLSLPLPTPALPDTLQSLFFSNDYEVFIRARDNEGKTDGTPPSIKFQVNFPPVLRQAPGAPPDTVFCFPSQGAVIDSSDAVADSLQVTFIADDVETPSLMLFYRAVLDTTRFGNIVGPPIRADSLLRWRFPFPEPGEHTLRYTVEDPGARTDELEVVFRVE